MPKQGCSPVLESYKWNRTYVIHTKNMGLAAWPVPSLILADIATIERMCYNISDEGENTKLSK